LILAVLLLFSGPISGLLQFDGHPEYVRWIALILAFDCLSELPFARLRLEQRPIRFVSAKIINIGINVTLNLFWLIFCPWAAQNGSTWVYWVWKPDWNTEYVFLANLVASIVTLALLLPQLKAIYGQFDRALWQRMLQYSGPLIIVGFAGIVDELFSRAMMPRLLGGTLEENRAQLGIFSANYKMAMLISLFTQAYRYAAEPFFFRNAREANSLQTQADTTKWFSLASTTGMLGILLFMDLIKDIFLGKKFHSGLNVVPILLCANLLLGLYYNFSVWYRLKDRTGLGAIVSIIGACITVGLNIILIPRYGYVGAAWVTLICYAFMTAATWWTGRKIHPVPYPLLRIFAWIAVALLIFAFEQWLKALWGDHHVALLWASRICLFLGYLAAIWRMERSK
jgi:O-antigen/teichoic acid export membrane protein